MSENEARVMRAAARLTRNADELRDMSTAEQGAILLTWAARLEMALGPADSVDVREVIEEMRATGLALAPPGAASPDGEALQLGARVRCVEPGSAYFGGVGTVREVEQTRHGWRYRVQWDGWSGGSEFCDKLAGCLVVLPPNAEAVQR